MSKMGDTISWPGKKMKKSVEKIDKSKWCDFHSDHGHDTTD